MVGQNLGQPASVDKPVRFANGTPPRRIGRGSVAIWWSSFPVPSPARLRGERVRVRGDSLQNRNNQIHRDQARSDSFTISKFLDHSAPSP
jgi:hypothetical protein